MPKQKSRSARWMEAANKAREAWDNLNSQGDILAEALADLQEVQSEYSDWLDNLPENLQSSALGEKLQSVMEIDIESHTNDPMENFAEVDQIISEAEGIDLPQGFGRD